MRVTNHCGVAALLAIAALLIAGCSGSEEEPAGLATTDPAPATSSSPPAEPDPTDEADPTPTATMPPALQELRTMEMPAGLVIESIPDADGAELAALDAYVRFEAARWQSLLDSEVSGELEALATDEVVERVADQVGVQVEQGFRLGGRVLMDTPQVEAAPADIAVVTACFNQGEVTVIRDGNEEIGEDAAANPVFMLTADVANSGAGWVVTDYRLDFEAC